MAGDDWDDAVNLVLQHDPELDEGDSVVEAIRYATGGRAAEEAIKLLEAALDDNLGTDEERENAQRRIKSLEANVGRNWGRSNTNDRYRD